MNEGVVALGIVFINAFQSGFPLVCLNCDDVSHPHSCKHVTECFQNEICGIETFISKDGDKKYKLGCFDKNEYQTGPTYWVQAVGHDNQQTTKVADSMERNCGFIHGINACHECCSAPNLCNHAGCNSTGYPSPRGPVCYNCKNLPPEAPCHQIGFCETEEVCHDDAILQFHSETLYSSGCRRKDHCANGVPPPLIGKRDMNTRPVIACNTCCSGDLCNTKCKRQDTCTDQHSCHLLMQHYDVCRYQDIASQFCELSCGLCRSSIACEDFISDCDQQSAVMGESMCMNYQNASRHGCLRYCGYCHTATPPPTQINTTNTCVDHGSCQLLMRHYDVCKYPAVARQFCRWSCRVCDVPTICEDTTYDCDLTQASTQVNICSDYQTAQHYGCLRWCQFCTSTQTMLTTA